MKVTVLRLTRHEATAEQLKALKTAVASVLCLHEDEFELDTVRVSQTVHHVDEVVALVHKYGAQVLDAVLPLGLLAEVVPAMQSLGVPVIRAVMHRVIKPDGEVELKFVYYERILRVSVETEPLER